MMRLVIFHHNLLLGGYFSSNLLLSSVVFSLSILLQTWCGKYIIFPPPHFPIYMTPKHMYLKCQKIAFIFLHYYAIIDNASTT